MRVKGRLIERASSILEMQKENVILIRYSQRQLEHFCKKKTKKVQNLVDAKVFIAQGSQDVMKSAFDIFFM